MEVSPGKSLEKKGFPVWKKKYYIDVQTVSSDKEEDGDNLECENEWSRNE